MRAPNNPAPSAEQRARIKARKAVNRRRYERRFERIRRARELRA